jgi:uncharacterized protein
VAIAPIISGETICIWGGWIVDYEQLLKLPLSQRVHSHQIEENHFMTSLDIDEPTNYFNHSCDPNAGFNGQIIIAAMRDILIGEEITFDYAMCDGSSYDEFICSCHAKNCRGNITGDDWKIRELWERYDGYFIPYLQKRIRKEKLLKL